MSQDNDAISPRGGAIAALLAVLLIVFAAIGLDALTPPRPLLTALEDRPGYFAAFAAIAALSAGLIALAMRFVLGRGKVSTEEGDDHDHA